MQSIVKLLKNDQMTVILFRRTKNICFIEFYFGVEITVKVEPERVFPENSIEQINEVLRLQEGHTF